MYLKVIDDRETNDTQIWMLHFQIELETLKKVHITIMNTTIQEKNI